VRFSWLIRLENSSGLSNILSCLAMCLIFAHLSHSVWIRCGKSSVGERHRVSGMTESCDANQNLEFHSWPSLFLAIGTMSSCACREPVLSGLIELDIDLRGLLISKNPRVGIDRVRIVLSERESSRCSASRESTALFSDPIDSIQNISPE
jgi:hypothetical protein